MVDLIEIWEAYGSEMVNIFQNEYMSKTTH